MQHTKKIMLLGGISYLLPVIKIAHECGYYVITADYLPNNIAHKFSDEYVNVNIIDKDTVLSIAQEKMIDGILSFAVDPGVVTAAYVAEKMNLPFPCSYEVACILQDKSKFREFLSKNGFNSPWMRSYSRIEEAIAESETFVYPLIVKPVDSAGSKGVSKVRNLEDLETAIIGALSESHCGRFIIEEFIEKKGYSVGSESFVLNGELVYNGIYDQYFDEKMPNPYVPISEIWPSELSVDYQSELKYELQRLFKLLDVSTGLFNIEGRIGQNGKLYLMEVSPRAGGNRLAEMLNYATDTNLIEIEVKRALKESLKEIHAPIYKDHSAIVVLHTEKDGVFDGVMIDEDFERKHVIEKEIRIKKGMRVSALRGANAAIGTIFLRFKSREEMLEVIENKNKWLKICVL